MMVSFSDLQVVSTRIKILEFVSVSVSYFPGPPLSSDFDNLDFLKG